jgi:hypothetical protein
MRGSAGKGLSGGKTGPVVINDFLSFNGTICGAEKWGTAPGIPGRS